MQICWEKLANWLIKESEKEGEFPIKMCTFPVGSLSKYLLVLCEKCSQPLSCGTRPLFTCPVPPEMIETQQKLGPMGE